MASRPSQNKNARPNTKRLSFEAKLRIFCALLCLPAMGFLTGLLAMAHFSTAAIVSILTIAGLILLLAIATFMDQVIRPLQTLANVVAALREEDYSFRARGAKRDDPFGDLAIEINALADMHQTQRLGALEAAALFRRVIAELDAPVLAFDQGEVLRLLNPAAERVFALNVARDLGRTAKELKLEMLLEQPDEGVILLDLQSQSARTPSRWMVRRSDFRQRGVPHTLLLLSDVSSALREEERLAWRRLIRVLGHEISNSLAPIKSIAGSLLARVDNMQGDDATLHDFRRGLGVVESRADSLHRFVQSYRLLAQLPPPQFKAVALGSLLERVVLLEQRLPVHLDAGPPVTIDADPDQLEQMFINLLRNAVDASLANGSQPVRTSWRRDESALVVTIEDRGLGIANTENLLCRSI